MLISHRTTRLLCAGALVLAAPTLASCSKEKATDKIYTPANAANDRSERIDVLNAKIVSTSEGSGTFIVTLVNNDSNAPGAEDDAADQLVGLAGEVTAKLAEPVDVPAGGIAVLAAPAGKGIKVTGEFKAGEFVEVTLTFKNAEEVTLEVPVVENAGEVAGQDGPAPEESAESMSDSH
jgi:copper(I)-binding protein